MDCQSHLRLILLLTMTTLSKALNHPVIRQCKKTTQSLATLVAPFIYMIHHLPHHNLFLGTPLSSKSDRFLMSHLGPQCSRCMLAEGTIIIRQGIIHTFTPSPHQMPQHFVISGCFLKSRKISSLPVMITSRCGPQPHQ